MSTYASSDPCTDLILDFIAGGVPLNPSGESRGDYNVVIGGSQPQPLITLRAIADIRNLQRQLVNNGEPSSAVGRYQIIEHTLDALCDELELSDDRLFDAPTQDLLGWRLLVNRGYRSWWRGEMTHLAFAHNLSCEWASLPDPRNGGKSHYDGVGANHASTTVAHVLTMLAEAHSLIRA